MSAANASEAIWPCRRCGNCCRVEGYVMLADNETVRLAGVLGLTVPDFAARFTRLTADRRGLSLVEKPDGSCVFLGEGNACRVQDAKPRQCRDFPLAWAFEGYKDICAAASAALDAEGSTDAR